MEEISVSLVVPVRNEEDSLEELFLGIDRQTLAPSEIIIVDGGSTDQTLAIVRQRSQYDSRIRLIETSGATPGKGRNIGITVAANEWVALTDGGIILEPDWLELMVKRLQIAQDVGIVYGDFAPVRDSFFEKIASLSYVDPKRNGQIRARFIASSLLNKKAWERVGGFPDWRAAEDLIFMDGLEAVGIPYSTEPRALVHWKLRPDLFSTFSKFVTYSKHNVWAVRQWDWHYGILKQYLLLVPFLILAILHTWFWLLTIPLWMMARTAKRILSHRAELGLTPLFNPLIVFGVLGLIFCIDMATFIGWIKALIVKKQHRQAR